MLEEVKLVANDQPYLLRREPFAQAALISQAMKDVPVQLCTESQCTEWQHLPKKVERMLLMRLSSAGSASTRVWHLPELV
jgi:hypothetical protein